jgi:N6-adenosine-specific RNA methylase IME4
MKQIKKARLVLMDPPWQGQGGEKFYDTMPIRRLLEFPLDRYVTTDSQLLLWVPNGMIDTGVHVAEQFGYTVRGVITWVKSKPGRPTRYLQANTELLLFCTRGDAPSRVRGQQSVMFAPTQLPSEKPAEQYAIAERLSEPPFLELFARTASKTSDWTSWGMELENAEMTVPEFPVPADFIEEAV